MPTNISAPCTWLEQALANNRKALVLRTGLVAEFPLNADYRRTAPRRPSSRPVER